eukprot:gene9320-9485_t
METEHRVDILVNNAGLMAKAAVVEAGSEQFRQVMDVNFFGCLDLVTAVAPSMIKQQSGTIVNVGSIASYSSQPFWGAYSASKSALQAVTDAMRVELQPFGIRVVYCAPGFIATKLDSKSQQSGLNRVAHEGPYAASERIKRWVYNTEGVDKGTPPDVFSKGLVQMALSSTPPAHYVAGKFSWVVWLLGHFAPYWVMDRMYSSSVGLNELHRAPAAKAKSK